jgi:hypothetical protein
MSSSPSPVHTHCQNCDTPLTGPYCSACGQRDLELHCSLGHLAEEALESFFHFDAKWFRGLRDLLFRPGFLSVEFNAGRRARQVPPLRFYLFTSFVFFVIAAFRPNELVINATNKSGREANGEKVYAPIQLNVGLEPDSGEASSSWWNRTTDALARKLETPEGQRAFGESFTHHVPKAMIAGLPLLALLTAWLFRTPALGYVHHLVVSLHLHAFFLLWLLLSDGLRVLVNLVSRTGAGILGACLTIYVFYYLYTACRRIFGRGRWTTIWRLAMTTALYSVGLVVLLVATLLGTIWSL